MRILPGFKSYTARQIIDHLEQQKTVRLLQRLHFAKAAHKQGFWFPRSPWEPLSTLEQDMHYHAGAWERENEFADFLNKET